MAANADPDDGLAPEGGGPRILLVDPAFADESAGHHAALNRGYLDLIGPDRCWLAVHRSLRRIDGVAPERIIPIFGQSPYDVGEGLRRGSIGRFLQALAYDDATGAPRQVRSLLQALLKRRSQALAPEAPRLSGAEPAIYRTELLEAISQLGLGPGDHVIFTSMDAEMGRAVLDLTLSGSACDLPAMHLRLMYDDGTATASPLDYDGLVERIAATGLLGTRLRLYAETPLLAEALSRRAKADVGVAPFPAKPFAPPPPVADRRIVVAFFGEARSEKGFDLLVPILRDFAARHRDLTDRVAFRIHAGGKTIEAARSRDALRTDRFPAALDVEVRYGSVAPAVYERMWLEADVVLAPQDPRVYAVRGSGVAQEAIAAGRPLICLAGSSLALDPDASVLAASDVEGLSDAVATFVRDPHPWLAKAAAGAGQFRDRLARLALAEACKVQAPLAPAPPVALVVGPWLAQGGSRQLMDLQCTTLTALGYQVVRVHLTPAGEASTVLSKALRGDLRDRAAVASFAGAAIPEGLADICRSGRVTLVLANLPPSADFVSQLDLGPDVVRIMETHDLWLDPVTGSLGEGPAARPMGFDAAVFVNVEEQAAWERAGQPQCVRIIPPLDDRTGSPRESDFAHDLLFLGSDHARNRRALCRLMQDILDDPACEGLTVAVGGSVWSPALKDDCRIVRLGELSGTGLEAAYASAKVVVAPCGGPGGLPSKVFSALARGAPLVADRAVADFLPPESLLLAKDNAEFRRKILEAVHDEAARHRLARAARAAWSDLGDPEAYAAAWRELLEGLRRTSGAASRSTAKRV